MIAVLVGRWRPGVARRSLWSMGTEEEGGEDEEEKKKKLGRRLCQ